MFKLVSLTALIAASQASAATDENKVKAEFNKQKAAAAKYNSTPSAKIWTQNKTTHKWHFMDATEAQSAVTFATTKNSDIKTCQDCYMSGNTWDKTSSKCTVSTANHADADKDATVDYTMEYKDWVSNSLTCAGADGVDNNAACKSSWTNLADFRAGKSTGKANDTPYSWSYTYDAGVADAWTTCAFSVSMPFKPDDSKACKAYKAMAEDDVAISDACRDHSWSGGLLLSHTLPDDVQAVVQVNTAASYLYNSYTLKKLSVGKTNKIVVPLADTIDITYTNMAAIAASADSSFSLEFKRQTNAQLAEFTIEHGGVIVWVIIGIVVFCLLCVGIIVWKKCFHKDDGFYLEDAYARV